MRKETKIRIASVIILYATVLILAITGKLGGMHSSNRGLILRDLITIILVMSLSFIFVKSITCLAKTGMLEPRDCRNTIHILSAPIYVMCWSIFSDVPEVKYFVAPISLLKIIDLLLAAKE